MDFTWKEIILAGLGSGGILGGLFTAVTFVMARVDKRKERKKTESQLLVSQSAEFRRIEIEDETSTDARWEKLANRYSSDITKLEEKNAKLQEAIEECEKAITLSRPTVTKIFQFIDLIERKMQSLRVAKCPDEVVDILNERLAQVQIVLDDLRKLVDKEIT